MSEGSHLTAEIRQRAATAVVDGMAIASVAAAFGVDRKTVSRWVASLRNKGSEALHRRAGSGRPRKLAELTEDELLEIVRQGAMPFGFETDLWTVARLRRTRPRAVGAGGRRPSSKGIGAIRSACGVGARRNRTRFLATQMPIGLRRVPNIGNRGLCQRLSPCDRRRTPRQSCCRPSTAASRMPPAKTKYGLSGHSSGMMTVSL